MTCTKVFFAHVFLYSNFVLALNFSTIMFLFLSRQDDLSALQEYNSWQYFAGKFGRTYECKFLIYSLPYVRPVFYLLVDGRPLGVAEEAHWFSCFPSSSG